MLQPQTMRIHSCLSTSPCTGSFPKLDTVPRVQRGRVTSRCLCWDCSVPSTGLCAFSGSLQFLDVALTSQTQHPDMQKSILTALPSWFEVIYKSVESTLHPIGQVKMGNNTSSSPGPWQTSLVTSSEVFKLSTSTFWLQSNIYIYFMHSKRKWL